MQKLLYKSKARLLAAGQKWRYGSYPENLSDDKMIRYVYRVTQDVAWRHWKDSVSADNTDVKALLRLALLTRSDEHIVEVGSWLGRTTCALGLLSKLKRRTGKVIAVDTFTGDPKHSSQFSFVSSELGGDYFPYFQKNIQAFGLEEIVAAVKGYSEQVYGKVDRMVQPQGAGLVFIDGDHSEEGVRKDVALYKDIVVKGGWIMFDDYNSEPVHNGAQWLRLQKEWRHYSLNQGKLGCFQKVT